MQVHAQESLGVVPRQVAVAMDPLSEGPWGHTDASEVGQDVHLVANVHRSG